MTDALTALKSSRLARVVLGDSTAHFTKWLAHLDADGMPPRWVFEEPRYTYVLETRNRLSRVETALKQSSSLIRQIEVPPAKEWLTTVGITPEGFYQQVLDHFTLVLYSTLDRCLLLANHLLALGVHDRFVSFRTMRKELKARGQDIEKRFSDLYKVTGPIADARHFFAHRGEPRNVKVFSQVARAKLVLGAWGAPLEGITFNDTEAYKELLNQMNTDLRSVCMRTAAALDSLCPHYQKHLALLGGLDKPSVKEVKRAISVVEYFKGGKRPSFMDANS